MLEPRSFVILLLIWCLLSIDAFPIDGHTTSTAASGRIFSLGSNTSTRLRNRLSLQTARYASRHHHQPATKFKDFEEMLTAYKDTPVLVTFHAKFCGPCKLVKKQLALVSDALGEQVKMFAVDTERWPKLGSRYQITGLPCIIVFKGGQVLDKIEGVETAEEIVRRIKTYVTD